MTQNKQDVLSDIDLADGFAASMGDGAYLFVQRDEYNRQHSVLITVEEIERVIAVERTRGYASPVLAGVSSGGAR